MSRSPYERIQELINLVELNPTPHQLVKFLSRNIDPANEICGAGWLQVNEEGRLQGIAFSGVKNSFDSRESIGLADHNVVAESLRIQKSIFFDMKEVFQKYRDATHKDALNVYTSGIVLPLNSREILGLVLESHLDTSKEYREYFELIRMILSLWLGKKAFEESNSSQRKKHESGALTRRQQEMLTLIKEGRTNASIASIVGYSESLIRQETISIYRKLGIQGRKDLILEKESISED